MDTKSEWSRIDLRSKVRPTPSYSDPILSHALEACAIFSMISFELNFIPDSLEVSRDSDKWRETFHAATVEST